MDRSEKGVASIPTSAADILGAGVGTVGGGSSGVLLGNCGIGG